jgi:hypothetical protein
MPTKATMSTATKRTKMAQKMLSENPHVTHEEVNKALKQKHGSGIDFYKFRTMKYGHKVEPRPTPTSAANNKPVSSMKAALKEGTVPTTSEEVVGFIKGLNERVKSSGIEKLEMHMVDGEPQWTVTERRQFTI